MKTLICHTKLLYSGGKQRHFGKFRLHGASELRDLGHYMHRDQGQGLEMHDIAWLELDICYPWSRWATNPRELYRCKSARFLPTWGSIQVDTREFHSAGTPCPEEQRHPNSNAEIHTPSPSPDVHTAGASSNVCTAGSSAEVCRNVHTLVHLMTSLAVRGYSQQSIRDIIGAERTVLTNEIRCRLR